MTRGYRRLPRPHARTAPFSRFQLASMAALLLFGIFCGAVLAYSQTTNPPAEVATVGQQAAVDTSNLPTKIDAEQKGTVKPQTDVQPATVDTQPAVTTPADPVAPDAQPAAGQSVKPTCNHGRQTAANQHYQSSKDDETQRHKHELLLLDSTSLITRLLSPSMYGQRLNSETDLHQAQLQAIQEQYYQALTAAHCPIP